MKLFVDVLQNKRRVLASNYNYGTTFSSSLIVNYDREMGCIQNISLLPQYPSSMKSSNP